MNYMNVTLFIDKLLGLDIGHALVHSHLHSFFLCVLPWSLFSRIADKLQMSKNNFVECVKRPRLNRLRYLSTIFVLQLTFIHRHIRVALTFAMRVSCKVSWWDDFNPSCHFSEEKEKRNFVPTNEIQLSANFTICFFAIHSRCVWDISIVETMFIGFISTHKKIFLLMMCVCVCVTWETHRVIFQNDNYLHTFHTCKLYNYGENAVKSFTCHCHYHSKPNTMVICVCVCLFVIFPLKKPADRRKTSLPFS